MIKSKLLVSLILILLVVLQSTILDYIKIFNTKPDILLVAIVIISLSFDLKWVLIFSYFTGFLKDILAVLPLGLNTLVLPLLGFLIFRLSKKIVIETNYMITVAIFISLIFENLAVSLLLIPLQLNFSLGIFFRLTIVSSVYTALLFFLLSKIIRIPDITSHS